LRADWSANDVSNQLCLRANHFHLRRERVISDGVIRDGANALFVAGARCS
jgi:hypothetical protein